MPQVIPTGAYSYSVPGHAGRTTSAVKGADGAEWYLTSGGQWRNAQTSALSRTAPSMIPQAGGNVNTTPGSPDPAQPAATPAAAAPPYFKYTVPGHGNTTQAIKDATGETWYETQGKQWRNVKTGKTQKNLPAWQAATPAAPATPEQPAATPVTAPTPGTFKSVRDFFGVGENPLAPSTSYSDYPEELGVNKAYDPALYEWQKSQGLKSLAARGSASGNLDSGAQKELEALFLNELGGMEADRRQKLEDAAKDRKAAAWGIASNAKEASQSRQANAAQGDYNTYIDQTNRESDRLTAQGNTQWSRIMDVINSLVGQDPSAMGYKATDTSASSLQELGKILAGLAGSGGGGGGSGGGYSTPPRRAPDYSGAAVSNQNTQDWIGLGTSLISALLK